MTSLTNAGARYSLESLELVPDSLSISMYDGFVIYVSTLAALSGQKRFFTCVLLKWIKPRFCDHMEKYTRVIRVLFDSNNTLTHILFETFVFSCRHGISYNYSHFVAMWVLISIMMVDFSLDVGG